MHIGLHRRPTERRRGGGSALVALLLSLIVIGAGTAAADTLPSSDSDAEATGSAPAAPADRSELQQAASSPASAAAVVAPESTLSPAATGPVVYRPTTGYFTVTGQGSGHGRGMSQYGARGGALAGKTATDMLNFYYPGTSTTKVSADHQMRIWISYGQGAASAPRSTVNDSPEVVTVSGLKVTDVVGRKVLTIPSSATAVTTRVKGDGFEVVAKVSGVWKHVADTAGSVLYSGPAQQTLIFSDGNRSYRGQMKAVRVGAGAMTVNIVGLDAYLRSVVPREMPAGWPSAALKVQAIAARTYAVANIRQPSVRSWDLCDTTYCQVYGGTSVAGGEVAATTTAIVETAGMIRTYQGSPINAQFGASSGGYTVDGGVPYLQAKADPWDRAGIYASVATWTEKLSVAWLQTSYPSIGTLKSIQVVSRDGRGAYGGRVLSLLVSGTGGSVTIGGDSLRSMNGWESNLFTVSSPDAGMNPVGQVERIERVVAGIRVAGWVADPSTPTKPSKIKIAVTGPGFSYATTQYADDRKNSLAAGYPEYGVWHGYDLTVPVNTIGKVSVCITGVNVGVGTANKSFGCRTFLVTKPVGALDKLSATGRTIKAVGWALSKDVPTGALPVALSYTSGSVRGVIYRTAELSRPDIGRSYPAAGPNHGVSTSFTVPKAGSYQVCLVAVQAASGAGRATVGCRTVTVS